MKHTALITGASGGIGYELARIFAKNGADLILVARNRDKLTDIKADLEKTYAVKVFVFPMDLSQPDAGASLFNRMAEQGIDPDILVNNAGFGSFGEFSRSEWEKERQMLFLNIIALTHLTKLFLNLRKGKLGKVLNVSSTAAFQPGPLMAVYYASKSYVLMFSEALSRELKGTGITVTALCPGPTETGFKQRADLGRSRLFALLKPAQADKVAEFGYNNLMVGKPVAVYGFGNRLMAFLLRFIPRNAVRNIIYWMQQEDR